MTSVVALLPIPSEIAGQESGAQPVSRTGVENQLVCLVVDKNSVALDEIIVRMDGDALPAVRYLIQEGTLRLVVIATPWGVDFEVELTEKARSFLASNIVNSAIDSNETSSSDKRVKNVGVAVVPNRNTSVQ